MEIKDIIALMEAVSTYGLTKLELEQNDTKLVLKREKETKIITVGAGVGNMVDASQIAGDGCGHPIRSDVSSSSVCETQNTEDSIVYTNEVTCPLVGTFYSAPSPDAENFVKIGDHVKKGQVLGIVEAMKLMNEIESEYDGIVEAILVENEATVEYGQPLFRIR